MTNTKIIGAIATSGLAITIAVISVSVSAGRGSSEKLSATGCSVVYRFAHDRLQQIDQSAVEVDALAAPPTGPSPIVLKSICDYERGKFCDSTCPGGVGCSTADEGWLCCNDAGTCVPVAIDGACSSSLGNIKGHCEFYTVDAAGNATCHD